MAAKLLLAILFVFCNAYNRAGTTTFEWAPGFAPASASDLAKGLHALTWNDRPLDQWD